MHDEFIETKLLEKLEFSRNQANEEIYKDADKMISEMKAKYDL